MSDDDVMNSSEDENNVDSEYENSDEEVNFKNEPRSLLRSIHISCRE